MQKVDVFRKVLDLDSFQPLMGLIIDYEPYFAIKGIKGNFLGFVRATTLTLTNIDITNQYRIYESYVFDSESELSSWVARELGKYYKNDK